MNKSKFFVLAGTVTLAITAIFATKPDKKFAGATSAFFQNNSSVWVTLFKAISATASRLTTTASTNPSAIFQTNGNSYQLYLTKSTTTPLYYKP